MKDICFIGKLKERQPMTPATLITIAEDLLAGKDYDSHSCPPRGGLVQGWESECSGVGGIPLIENKK